MLFGNYKPDSNIGSIRYVYIYLYSGLYLTQRKSSEHIK